MRQRTRAPADRRPNHFVRCVLAEAAQHDFRKNLWQSCVTYYIAANENAFSLREERRQEAADEAGCGKDPFARHDCSLLRRLFSLALAAEAQKPGAEMLAALADYEPFRPGSAEGMLIETLRQRLEEAADDEAFYDEICRFYRNHGVGLFGMYQAFTLAADRGAVQLQPDHTNGAETLDDLIGYEVQKEMLTANTEAFVQGKPANNVLLYGDGGTGKSTSIRALLHRYGGDGLRIIQVYRHQLQYLPEVIAEIKNRKYRFLIYMMICP